MGIFFPAAGADLVIAADYCAGKLGSSPGGASALASCSSQCAPLYRGYGSCQNVECLCPTVSSNGAACSDCLAGINTADAGVVGSLMSQCGIGGSPVTLVPGTTAPQTVVIVQTGSSLASLTATVVAATSASRSAGQGMVKGSFDGSYLGMFGVIAIFLGSIAILLY